MYKPHDITYKEIFSHPEFVQQLMEGFAPEPISRCLDYDTLQIHPGNYITPLFDEKLEDLVWSVEFKPPDEQSATTIYLHLLLEFQSTVDATMPLRMLHYVASFYHQLIKQNKISLAKDKLPPVFPIVLYNGEPRWSPPQDMRALIQPVPKFLQRFQPQMYYYLVDEGRLIDAQLAQQPSPLSGLFAVEKAANAMHAEFAVKQLVHKARSHPDRERIGRVVVNWIKHYFYRNNFDIDIAAIKDLEDIPDMLDLNRERQEWKQEGKLEGKLEGRQETAENLLHLGWLTEEQIAEASNLTIEQVRILKTKNRH